MAPARISDAALTPSELSTRPEPAGRGARERFSPRSARSTRGAPFSIRPGVALYMEGAGKVSAHVDDEANRFHCGAPRAMRGLGRERGALAGAMAFARVLGGSGDKRPQAWRARWPAEM